MNHTGDPMLIGGLPIGSSTGSRKHCQLTLSYSFLTTLARVSYIVVNPLSITILEMLKPPALPSYL